MKKKKVAREKEEIPPSCSLPPPSSSSSHSCCVQNFYQRMMCINDRFTSRLLPPQAIIKPMSQAACWVDWHRKKTTQTAVAVSSDPPPIGLARHSIASKAETQNHHKRRCGWKQGSTAKPSKSVASSETMYAYRSAPSKSFGPSETLYQSCSYQTPRRFQCHA